MRSRLNNRAYPQANPDQWLVFIHSWQKGIDPVFAARLAALARSRKKKIVIVSGFRTYREQLGLFKLYKGKRALKPGTSWHEFGGAVDISSLWVRKLDNVALPCQYELARFGLAKPFTHGNGFDPAENWHLQPLEMACITSRVSKIKFYRAYRTRKI
ncbi:MAG: D-alanyl-D-alanine carboxypeptidase family protein [Methylocystaceae bacterium]